MVWGIILVVLFWLILLTLTGLFLVCKQLVDYYDGPEHAIQELWKVGVWIALKQTRMASRSKPNRGKLKKKHKVR